MAKAKKELPSEAKELKAIVNTYKKEQPEKYEKKKDALDSRLKALE